MGLELIMSGAQKVPTSAALRARASQVADELQSGDLSIEGAERVRCLRLFADNDCVHVDDAFWLTARLARIDSHEARELARECLWQVFPIFAVDVMMKAVRFQSTLHAPSSPETVEADAMLRRMNAALDADLDRVFRSEEVLKLLERIGTYFNTHILPLVTPPNRGKCVRLIQNIESSVCSVRELYK